MDRQTILQQIEHQMLAKDLGKIRQKILHERGVSTRIPALDQILSAQGIRRSWLSEFIGEMTSGALTVALTTAKSVQQENEAVVWVDLKNSFDPLYAVACGIDLERFYLITPSTTATALAMIYDMVMTGGVGLIILDTVWHWSQTMPVDSELGQWFSRLTNRLHHSRTALIVLTPSHVQSQGWLDTAVLRLHFSHQEWIYQGQDIRGWLVQVQVLKDRFNPARPQTTLYLEHPELG